MFAAPKLTAADATAANATCRLAAVAAREFGLDVAFRGKAASEEAFEIALTINGAEILLFVPPRLLQRAARDFFGLVGDYELPESLVAASLEVTAAAWIERLETAAGVEMSVRRVAVAKPEVSGQAPFAFALPGIGENGVIGVRPSSQLQLPKLPDVTWTNGDSVTLRLPMVAGEVGVSVAELEELQVGDVVVLQGAAKQDATQVAIAILPGKTIIATVDGQKLAIARVGNSMSTSDAAGGDAKSAQAPKAAAPAGAAPAAAAPAKASEPLMPAASIEELPIRIVFDLGEVELTLAELKALVPGQVINLARDPGNAVRVSVNGRRIGAGEIVEIEGRLGVRITELGGRHELPAS